MATKCVCTTKGGKKTVSFYAAGHRVAGKGTPVKKTTPKQVPKKAAEAKKKSKLALAMSAKAKQAATAKAKAAAKANASRCACVQVDLRSPQQLLSWLKQHPGQAPPPTYIKPPRVS